MHGSDLSADDVVDRFLTLSGEGSCLLDSCAVGGIGSNRLVAGISPTSIATADDAGTAFEILDSISRGDQAVIFTLSYDLGNLIHGISTNRDPHEPLVFAATFDSLVIHDYATQETRIAGHYESGRMLERRLAEPQRPRSAHVPAISARTNVTRAAYLQLIEAAKEEIRMGNTYQSNLTRNIEARLDGQSSPASIFRRLRDRHPAPFSAYIERPGSTVISASPERFFKIESGSITASPIKGTRPRGSNEIEDSRLRTDLLNSEKDRAENTMIVDLLRNDLGRVCEFGTVKVESLCEIQQHPSLYHLVSTINGRLRPGSRFSDILTAVFPCGSITGAPKLSTMRIIDRLESSPRGLSMGAIGYYLPASFGLGESFDLSVAIRTMVIRNGMATFNVGGGIVIDSDPESEWEETITKSRSLLDALGIDPAEGVME